MLMTGVHLMQAPLVEESTTSGEGCQGVTETVSSTPLIPILRSDSPVLHRVSSTLNASRVPRPLRGNRRSQKPLGWGALSVEGGVCAMCAHRIYSNPFLPGGKTKTAKPLSGPLFSALSSHSYQWHLEGLIGIRLLWTVLSAVASYQR